jgi:hypothetical protein
MRIIYAAGNRVGSGSQLTRILPHLTNHEIRTAGYLINNCELDWTLNALKFKVLGSEDLVDTNSKSQLLLDLISHIEKFGPDLIISDNDIVLASIAKKLKIKLWYCSPINLIDGLILDFNLRYYSIFQSYLQLHKFFPTPDKIFIYSPFGDIKVKLQLKLGFEWITPYFKNPKPSNYNNDIAIINHRNRYKDLSNILKYTNKVEIVKNNYEEKLYGCKKMLTPGETSYVADAIYAEKNLVITPDLNDYETLINARIIKECFIGTDIGQVELMDKYSLDKIENALSREHPYKYLSKQNYPFLHEVINATYSS